MDDDRDLFWTCLEVEHQKAEAFCRRLAGNLPNGDDLYQDALLLAMRSFHKLHDKAAFRPWLYRIIVNTFASSRRGSWRKRRVELTTELIETIVGENPGSRYEAGRWVRLGMAALSPDERALVTLFEIEGWTVAELSEMNGRSQGTIKSRLARARAKMRNAIAGYLPQGKTRKLKEVDDYALPQSQTEIG